MNIFEEISTDSSFSDEDMNLETEIVYDNMNMLNAAPNSEDYFASNLNDQIIINLNNNGDSMDSFDNSLESAEIIILNNNELMESQNDNTIIIPCPTSEPKPLSYSPENINPNIGGISRVTIQWLLDNYETAEGKSLPRSTLYAHYLHHCSEENFKSVNAASFGKLIRSVFLGLRTRRLGTRGNSKYHYYGIQIKPTSTLTKSNIVEAANPAPTKKEKYLNRVAGGCHREQAACLGDASGMLPNLPPIKCPLDYDVKNLMIFRSIYKVHLEYMIDAIVNLEFHIIESALRDFWDPQFAIHITDFDDDLEKITLTRLQLYSICNLKSVQDFMDHADTEFFQNVSTFLMPHVLKPIPELLTKSIRLLCRNLERWISNAIDGSSPHLLQLKLSSASAFCSSMMSYTSLNHVATSARKILQNGNQIGEMMKDLDGINFNHIGTDVTWLGQLVSVARFEVHFKNIFTQRKNLEQWALSLENVVKSILVPYENSGKYVAASKQFLLEWQMFGSRLMKEITVRKTNVLGPLYIMHMLENEYLFYFLRHQAAKTLGILPIRVAMNSIAPEDCEYSEETDPMMFESDSSNNYKID